MEMAERPEGEGGMTEGDNMRRIMIAVSKWGARFWRNNVALAWVGKPEVIRSPKRVAVGPGDVVLRNARPLHAGLCKGSHDLIGAVPFVVRPEHVGRKIAAFGSLEVKTESGAVRDDQENFSEQINALGGLAGIARCEEDAIRIISQLSN
jgi:hypothetical protein